jgi:hypothetical protein
MNVIVCPYINIQTLLLNPSLPYIHNILKITNQKGRGAPEIDIVEAMPGHAKMPPSPIEKPYFSTSLQIAPGIDGPNRPNKVWVYLCEVKQT